MPTSTDSDLSPEMPFLAAVDLGSNSFHMKVVRVVDDELEVVDRIREMVRLASGLDENVNLTDEAMQRATDCLSRFGERLRDIPSDQVRVVGTNTLRRAGIRLRSSVDRRRRAWSILVFPTVCGALTGACWSSILAAAVPS